MAVCDSWRNFNKIIALCSGIIICSHSFTCFCTSLTESRWDSRVQETSAFRSFRFPSSFKMSAPTEHLKSINQHFELEYLMCVWSFIHFVIIYYICEHSCVSRERLKWRWTIPLMMTYNKKSSWYNSISSGRLSEHELSYRLHISTAWMNNVWSILLTFCYVDRLRWLAFQ